MFFQTIRRFALGAAAAVAVASTLVVPAFAAPANNSVTQVITSAGSLGAYIDNASMTAITYSNSQGATTGTLNMHVTDPTGSGAGWNVTVKSSDFAYGGTSLYGQAIPASGYTIASLGAPSVVAGEARDAQHGPNAYSSSLNASLDSARKVISADPGFGSGDYDQAIGVGLVIPAQSQAGTYTATLTVLIASAP